MSEYPKEFFFVSFRLVSIFGHSHTGVYIGFVIIVRLMCARQNPILYGMGWFMPEISFCSDTIEPLISDVFFAHTHATKFIELFSHQNRTMRTHTWQAIFFVRDNCIQLIRWSTTNRLKSIESFECQRIESTENKKEIYTHECVLCVHTNSYITHTHKQTHTAITIVQDMWLRETMFWNSIGFQSFQANAYSAIVAVSHF